VAAAKETLENQVLVAGTNQGRQAVKAARQIRQSGLLAWFCACYY